VAARALLSRPPVRVTLAVLVVVAAGAGVWYGFLRTNPPAELPHSASAATLTPDPPPPDPRLAYPTPFRNVRPDVKYVGDAACADCHLDIDRTYHDHPMGRSAAITTRATPVERYDATAHTSFAALGSEMRVERAGDVVRHRVTAKGPDGVPLPDYLLSADVAIGSGAQGRSYLSVEGGSVWQTPISWFTREKRWDLSPGFAPHQRRGVVSDCLFCHTNRVEPVPGSVNRYREPVFAGQLNVGCERCHGPGELHVVERSVGRIPDGVDTSIVNPRHLDADLRAGVCRQCHLQGHERLPRRGRSLFEYRPGLPWEQFAAVFFPHADFAGPNRAVGQFEQMEQSRCFTRSAGKLDCTSCHDPHAKPAPAAADAYYRDRCLTCHESQGCSLPVGERQAKGDSCVSCHMPRADSSNIVHTAVTDHRIPRRPGPASAGRPSPGSLPVLPYRPGPHDPPAAERERDYGIVLAALVGRLGPGPGQGLVAQAAHTRLHQSLTTWPGDADAWGALATLLLAGGDAAGALEAARTAAALAPGSESRLGGVVSAALAAGDLDLAARTADELIGLNPKSSDHRVSRAIVALRRERWTEAEADCRAALGIHPLDPVARLHLAACRNRLGDATGARREADAAVGLVPPTQKAAYEDWYRRLSR
jgi:predicted CXXCH cytochrome family protein